MSEEIGLQFGLTGRTVTIKPHNVCRSFGADGGKLSQRQCHR